MHRTLPVLLLIVACTAQPVQEQVHAEAKPVGALGSADTTQLAQYVVGAFEDSKGGLWFGTIENGVAHVKDGKLSFIDSTHGLPPNGGHSIAEAKDGTIWFAGHDGVYTYHPDKGSRVKQIYRSEGRVGNDRKGNVWVSTTGRVLRQEGELGLELEVPVPAEPPSVYSITQRSLVFQMEDSEGNLWFSTDGHGAFRYDGKSFTRFTKKDGLCSNTPWAIAEDADGRIWFACIQAYQPKMTGDGGLCVLEKDGSFRTFPDVVGLHHNELYTLYKDREGNFYSSAVGTGMYRIKGDDFTLFNTTDRPDLNAGFGLQAMLQDRKGRLWCGFSGGLFRFDSSAAETGGASFVNVTRGGPWE